MMSFGACFFALAFSLFVPLAASAAVTSVSHVVTILDRLAGWLYTVLVGLAIIFFLFAGFQYLTAAGNPEKVRAASQMLLYAAISFAVGLTAKGVVFLVAEVIAR